MKVYKKEEFIAAMKATAKEYIDGTHAWDCDTCKLCLVAGAKGHSDECKVCPWVIITGKMCSSYDSDSLSRATELLDWVEKYKKADIANGKPVIEPFSIEVRFDNFEEAAFLLNVFGESNADYSGSVGSRIYNTIFTDFKSKGIKFSYTDKISPFWAAKNGNRNYWSDFKAYIKEEYK
jgi:hypothetical protein